MHSAAHLPDHLGTELLTTLVYRAPLPMAYYCATTLRCRWASHAYAQLWELDADELCRRTLTELATHPDLAALARRLAQQITQAQQSGTPATFEATLPPPPGSLLPRTIEVSVTPDSAGPEPCVCVVLTDITRHREIERAISESEGRLARFMHAGAEGILFHRDGRILDANPACCELLGCTLHALLGRPLLDLLAPEQRAQVERRHGRHDDFVCETALLDHDGGRIPVELIDRPTLQHGQPLRMVVLRDLRDRGSDPHQLQYLAHHDALTGLPNRQGFMRQLEHLMLSARKSQTELALLFIDLDHFQRLNDSIGHAGGDTQLQLVAQRISTCVRTSDRVARFGGDEFMVLLPGIRDLAAVARVAQKLQAAVSAPIEIEQRPISVTPSIGIAIFPRDGDTPELLIKHADTAMHVAKARGRAGHAFFEPEVAASAYANLVLEGQLGQALAQDEFALLFQPQVRCSDGRLLGAEALIRWRHPERGLLAPDEFIPLAEQHRLMLPIGAWVLHEAARCARHWHDLGLEPLSIAVNLSTLQFQMPGFVASIEQLLQDAALPAGWLELELTERMLMDDLPQVRERLEQLRALGVRISVDDFGTGTSSLGHLKELPLDKLKIDRSFVKDLPQDRRSGAITTALIQLAHGLELCVVAEGVETDAQRHYLAERGCDQLQGLGISAPLTAAQFEQWRL